MTFSLHSAVQCVKWLYMTPLSRKFEGAQVVQMGTQTFAVRIKPYGKAYWHVRLTRKKIISGRNFITAGQ